MTTHLRFSVTCCIGNTNYQSCHHILPAFVLFLKVRWRQHIYKNLSVPNVYSLLRITSFQDKTQTRMHTFKGLAQSGFNLPFVVLCLPSFSLSTSQSNSLGCYLRKCCLGDMLPEKSRRIKRYLLAALRAIWKEEKHQG